MRITTAGRRRITVGLAAILALVLIWGLASWWHAAHRSALVKALDLVPGDAQRISWTSWSAVITEVGTKGGTTGILSRAYDADVSSASALVTSAPALDKLGLSLRDVSWELYAQADDGAVDVLRLTDAGTWAARLAKAGWHRSGSGSHAVYDGSAIVSELGVSPELTWLTFSGGRLIASDNEDYTRKVADHDMVKPPAALVSVASALATPVAAEVYSGDYTCGHLAMSQAADLDQQQARVLLKAAGGVDPMSAFAMGYAPDAHHVTVAMDFDNKDIARHDADARATLASGDAPGQGGTFRDRFTVGKVEADGTRVTMRLTPHRGQSVLSDLSSGPVLFASC